MATDAGQEWSERGNNPLAQLRVMRHLLDQYGLDMANDAYAACQGADLIISQFTTMIYGTSIAEKLGTPHMVQLLQPPVVATRSWRGHDERTPAHPQKLAQLSLWQTRHPARGVVDLRQQRQPFPPDHPRSAPPNPIRERGPASARPLHPLLQPPRRAPGPGLAEQCADHGLSFFG